MKTDTAKDLELVLKSLANKRRIEIFTFLQLKGRRSVVVIAKEIKLSFRSTSKHLQLMYRAGLLAREQDGLVVWYSIDRKSNTFS